MCERALTLASRHSVTAGVPMRSRTARGSMVAINGVESGRFQEFLLVLTGNVLDQVTTVRCVNFFGPVRLRA